MKLSKLMQRQDGQGLVEYTLMLVLVALVFWVAIKGTDIGGSLTSAWNDVKTCVDSKDNKTGC